MEKYGPLLDREPIEFAQKSFVLAGLKLLEEEHGVNFTQEITSRDGVVRTDVSGRTDYLVADPRWGHESKLRAALVQRSKGKPIRIVLGTDLLRALGFDAPEAETVEETPAVETVEETPVPEVAEDPAEALRIRYDELTAQREEQQTVIAANKGWFGEAAKRRKAAQALLDELEQTISREFPDGRP
jgi:hypothetical protein